MAKVTVTVETDDQMTSVSKTTEHDLPYALVHCISKVAENIVRADLSYVADAAYAAWKQYANGSGWATREDLLGEEKRS